MLTMDDYSYLNSYPADGETGTEVSWNDRTLICGKEEHEHTAECYELVCDKEEHSHENCTLNCTHVHTLSCWGLDSNDRVDKPMTFGNRRVGSSQELFIHMKQVFGAGKPHIITFISTVTGIVITPADGGVIRRKMMTLK